MTKRNATCFLLQPTDLIQVRLRRYMGNTSDCPAPGNHGMHQAWVLIGNDKEIEGVNNVNTFKGPIPDNDPRWPTKCDCGLPFPEDLPRQYFPQHLYRRTDNGELVTWRDAPGGAMLVPDWYDDPKPLLVKLPNGWEWNVDSRASNCDSPCQHCQQPYHSHNTETCSNPGDGEHKWTKGAYVDGRPHACWVRHGEPPLVTVDKNGVTCNAGAGSIIGGNWHGFLRNGVLEEC